jgi:sporulation protein YlmC with PRC-barrel domain
MGKESRPDFYLNEILDQQLRDREGRAMGMVDGLTLEIRTGLPPRITHIMVGGETLGHRLRGPLGRLVRALARRWGVRKGEPYRIPWSTVRDVGVDIEVDIDASDTPTLHWEHWARHVIERIPGA